MIKCRTTVYKVLLVCQPGMLEWPMIKAITFDLEGVYFVSGKSNFIKNVVSLGVSETEAKRVFLDSDEMKRLYKMGKWSDSQYWNWAINEWKIDKTRDEIVEMYIDGCAVDEKVVAVVKKLRENGYKTMICTDNFPARINGMQKKFGFLDNFDVKVISYEVGATKSSREIYLELIKQAGVPPEEIVFSDDDENKLVAARGLGIKTLVYENFDQFMNELKELDMDVELKDLKAGDFVLSDKVGIELKTKEDFINKTCAHCSLVYTIQHFQMNDSSFEFSFFDKDDLDLVKGDLWLIGHTAGNLMDIFYGINKNYKLLTFSDNFINLKILNFNSAA